MIELLKTIQSAEGKTIYYPAIDNAASAHIVSKKKLDWDFDFASIPEIAELKPGDVVLDVGAWIGDTTEVFTKKGCIVHAFEPREDTYLCLVQNCPEAHCYNIALGNGEKYTTDLRGGNTGAYSLINGGISPGSGKVSVNIDYLFYKYGKIDFIKIDVEGYEAEVLKGGQSTIVKHKPTIHIEINPEALAKFNENPESIMDRLKQLGYTYFREVYRYYTYNWDIIAK